jgi:uncharacterized protein (TIGR02147 family)
MNEISLNYREFLLKELKKRRGENPAYSLRAFSRDLRVSISRMSEVLTGKTGLSVERAKSFAEYFGWPAEQTNLFLDLVEAEHSRSRLSRELAKKRLQQRSPVAREMPGEEFSLIAEWYYVPLIELLQTKPAQYTPAFLGARLGLDEITATTALMKLQEMGLIAWREGLLVPTNEIRTTTKGVPSSATRKFHRQILQKAEASLETQSLDKRIVTSAVMAMDQQQLEMVQERIRLFRNELMKDLEAAPAKNAVYCMTVSFFEMTEGGTP